VSCFLQSHRLSEAEFLTFARTLVSDSPSLAAAFGPEASSSPAIRMQSGHFGPSCHLDRPDAKRQRFGKCSDLILTAHALMALNNANQQTAAWNLFSQAHPSTTHFRPQASKFPAAQQRRAPPRPHHRTSNQFRHVACSRYSLPETWRRLSPAYPKPRTGRRTFRSKRNPARARPPTAWKGACRLRRRLRLRAPRKMIK